MFYAGVNDFQWDSKRIWEALASGCYILYQTRPDIDQDEYPIDEAIPNGKINTLYELKEKYEILLDNPSLLNQLRITTHENALRFFTPKPIARYFLHKILSLRNRKC